MTEGPNHFLQIDSDQELETAAVIGAAAVQKLIADRSNLRMELAASRAAQEDLKRQFAVLHQRYVELGKTILSQLQQFDTTMREAIGERAEANGDTAGPKRQFDGNGVPMDAPVKPSGANGQSYGRAPLPVEP
jgi:hypothetical protein